MQFNIGGPTQSLGQAGIAYVCGGVFEGFIQNVLSAVAKEYKHRKSSFDNPMAGGQYMDAY